MKVALVSNIPAPYRVPIFKLVAKEMGENFLVIYCARLEPNRQWDLTPFEFNHTYLKESYFVSRGVYIHNNLDVIKILQKFKPDVVITSGFNPTHLYAWGYTLVTGSVHVPMTDGWIVSERNLGVGHRMVRKLIFRTSRAFIGASKHSLNLYRSYGLPDSVLFQSHLCIDNDKFIHYSFNRDRIYDLMFSGQIIERKIPEFFVNVVRIVKNLHGKISVLVIGDGPLKDSFLNSLKELGVEVIYPGFISQSQLPSYYSQAKILLLTTKNDAWGIVANEALASGTPVIMTPYAGAANDLVINGKNGFVIGIDASLWASKIIELLHDENLLEQIRLNAVSSVAEFNFDNAARGIIDAAKSAYNRANGFLK